MRWMVLFSALLLAGCTHVAGTVYEAGTSRPLAGATFTVGHPGGIGVFARHTSNAEGHFDFYIAPTDESHLYVFSGDPTMARRVDRSEISEQMKVYVRRNTEMP